MEHKTTQREIKRLIKVGAAIELTDAKTINAGRLEVVALSFGVYGMNGGLFRDHESGQLYAIPRRNSILFYYA